MGPSYLPSILGLLFAIHCARSQYLYPNPYGNYAYQQPNQQAVYPNQGYPSYYQPQGYQPYYYYYPSNPYVSSGQQMNYAYPYVYYNNPGGQNGQYYYPTQNTEETGQGSQGTTSKPESTTKDPFADIKSEVIDVDPQHFNYLMGYMNMQPNAAQQAPRKVYRKPSYTVKVDSNSSNQTSVPNVMTKHDVQHKTYTFRKTYVITPEDRGKVINLSFVNGVQVTSPKPESLKEETTTISEDVSTTTESENPNAPTKKSRRFIDVPGSCPEGSRYVAGKCFKKFGLSLGDGQFNATGDTTDGTPTSNVQVSTNVTVRSDKK